MESIAAVKKHYIYTPEDDEKRVQLANILLPFKEELAEDFHSYLLSDPYTAQFFQSDEALTHRNETIKTWFEDVLTSPYDGMFMRRLQRIGKVHVRIGLSGHYVNSAMNFIRSFCLRQVHQSAGDTEKAEDLSILLNKIIDISLDVMTSSYREEELKRVFLSHRLESNLVKWSGRLLHGLNLTLMVGLLVLAIGVAGLLCSDIYSALSQNLETGVIKTLGSLLILWIMIELLQTQIEHLKGGRFRVIVFVELALVAFIRKIFVASIEKMDPIYFGLLLAGFLIIGLVFYLVGKGEEQRQSF
ncbi:MAG: heme-binding sensor globin domain-containing protein [Desulfobacteraceae bacterium]|jgi:uncharacterized membrane protein (DUF373 family)|nr:MAG: heme-binding sensor globin domain-containing protein [Desulfobacteraceae bacterium]